MGGDLQTVGLASPGTRIGGGTDEIQLTVLGRARARAAHGSRAGTGTCRTASCGSAPSTLGRWGLASLALQLVEHQAA